MTEQGTRAARATGTGMLLVLMLMGPGLGQHPESIAGRWRGESICVKADWNAACHDEQVVYDVAPDSTAPGRMRFHASKIVGGRPEWMGDLDLEYRRADSTWFGDFSNTRVRIRWEYRVHGDSLTGRVVDLETGRVGRAVRAARLS